MHFDEAGRPDQRQRRGDCRIVALGVPHREHRPTRLSRGDQRVGLRNRPRHRLFDEDGDSALEQR